MIKKAVAKIALGEFRGFQDDDEEKPIVKATNFLKNFQFFFTKYNRSISFENAPFVPTEYKEYEYSLHSRYILHTIM